MLCRATPLVLVLGLAAQAEAGREPVLKKLVLGWLTQKSEVLAFCQARPADGGAGAVMVMLRA